MDKKDPGDSVLVIPIIGEITWELADGLYTSTWEYIKIAPETEKFVVVIASTGGDRDAGWAIYDILKAFNREVITVALSGVCSSAVYVFMAGDKRYAFPDATFLFHPTVIAADKDEETAVTTFREYIMSDKMSNARQTKILKTWDVPQRIIRKMEGKREHFYLNADRAIEFNFVNKIITSTDKPWEL